MPDTQTNILHLQRKLITLGFALPRFGADGELGDETRQALAEYARQRSLANWAEAGLIQAVCNEPTPVEDETGKHPGLQWRPRSVRPWTQITGITLHQTAVLLGEEARRWHTLNAHMGITRAGRALLVCPLERVVWHANGLNATDVGIEIDGYFEGVEGLRNTLWNPPSDPARRALTPTQEQIDAVRRAIGWICGIVQARGGKVQFIHAHRQSSRDRQSDPGSFLWREAGLWAQREFGLTDGGRDFAVGTGLKIPEAWDRSRTGIRY